MRLSWSRSTPPTPPRDAAPAVQPPSPVPDARDAGGGAALAAVGAHDVFVARQPIFDERERLFAYELLYRSGAEQTRAAGATPEQMSTDTVLHALMSIGLASLTGGRLAFVNLTREFLLRGLYELFDPSTVVLELLETVEPDPEVIRACERLRAYGYRLALDDFVNAPGYEPLLSMAEIVKIDVLGRAPAELARVADELARHDVRLLAERVETAAVRDSCRRLGYTLFQGYFHARPQIVSHRELGVDQSAIVRLMNRIDDPGVADAEVEDAFKADPSLSYKLLRIANSAAFGGREVASIGHAMRLVGRKPLHRWLSLLLVSTVAARSGVAGELALQALARGRMAELLAERSGRGALGGSHFLAGLCSRLDALLGVPMPDVLARMRIAAEVRSAVLEGSGPLAPALALVDAQERGDWARVEQTAAAAGVTPAIAHACYAEAIGWAGEQLTAF